MICYLECFDVELDSGQVYRVIKGKHSYFLCFVNEHGALQRFGTCATLRSSFAMITYHAMGKFEIRINTTDVYKCIGHIKILDIGEVESIAKREIEYSKEFHKEIYGQIEQTKNIC